MPTGQAEIMSSSSVFSPDQPAPRRDIMLTYVSRLWLPAMPIPSSHGLIAPFPRTRSRARRRAMNSVWPVRTSPRPPTSRWPQSSMSSRCSSSRCSYNRCLFTRRSLKRKRLWRSPWTESSRSPSISKSRRTESSRSPSISKSRRKGWSTAA